jgi:hypothetical protein
MCQRRNKSEQQIFLAFITLRNYYQAKHFFPPETDDRKSAFSSAINEGKQQFSSPEHIKRDKSESL